MPVNVHTLIAQLSPGKGEKKEMERENGKEKSRKVNKTKSTKAGRFSERRNWGQQGASPKLFIGKAPTVRADSGSQR